MVKEASRGIHRFKHLWRVQLSLHAEPVSGFSAVSVVSVAAVDSTIPGISGRTQYCHSASEGPALAITATKPMNTDVACKSLHGPRFSTYNMQIFIL
jgi:hypothetical protein